MNKLMKREYVASTYIINHGRVLLIYHPKLQKWLPPGGHVESNETPSEAARREVLEETGFLIEFILQENIWVTESNAKSIERPFLCLLEEIPPHRDVPAHQHVDFVFLAKPIAQENKITDHQFQWFSLKELDQLKLEIELFSETYQIIKNIFSSNLFITLS